MEANQRIENDQRAPLARNFKDAKVADARRRVGQPAAPDATISRGGLLDAEHREAFASRRQRIFAVEVKDARLRALASEKISARGDVPQQRQRKPRFVAARLAREQRHRSARQNSFDHPLDGRRIQREDVRDFFPSSGWYGLDAVPARVPRGAGTRLRRLIGFACGVILFSFSLQGQLMRCGPYSAAPGRLAYKRVGIVKWCLWTVMGYFEVNRHLSGSNSHMGVSASSPQLGE